MSDLRKAAQPEPFKPDWDRVNALEESLREHMAEIHRLKSISQPEQEPEQEPVAYQWLGTSVIRKRIPKTAEADAWTPLYTAPPQRKPLTEEEILPHIKKCAGYYGYTNCDVFGVSGAGFVLLARAIEKAHGIGETNE